MHSGFGKQLVFGLAGLVFVSGLVFLLPRKAAAIPAFSRQYGTSCTTCHVDFPKLNDFGKAFKDAGFKFPKDDESFVKIPPVMLGSPAQKELWPKTVWPGTIPGIPQIGLRMNSFFQVVGNNRSNYDPLTAVNGIPQFVPQTDFQTGFFSIFTAGNFGSDIAFWVDDDISVGGENANGALGDGYLRFVNLGRFVKLPKDSLTLRAGQFELDLPFTQARTINLSDYDIYAQANIGAMNPLYPQQNVNNNFVFINPAQGVEVSGGHNYGGYHYSLAVVDQNTSSPSGNSATASPYVPVRQWRWLCLRLKLQRPLRKVCLSLQSGAQIRLAAMTFRQQGRWAHVTTPRCGWEPIISMAARSKARWEEFPAPRY